MIIRLESIKKPYKIKKESETHLIPKGADYVSFEYSCEGKITHIHFGYDLNRFPQSPRERLKQIYKLNSKKLSTEDKNKIADLLKN